MEKTIQMLSNCILFRNIDRSAIREVLQALDAYERSCSKGDILLHAGDVTDYAGIVLEGSVSIENNDYWGNRAILSIITPGHMFAETYAYLPGEVLLVDATANEDCRILFLKLDAMTLTHCAQNSWYPLLLRNFLQISARKNLMLSGRSFHTAPKSARSRIMSYLHAVSLQQHSRTFDIDFDRQQMADYLNLDRTALSKELGRMQKDGLIRFHRNHFSLLADDDRSL